jgi:O-antigen ligase
LVEKALHPKQKSAFLPPMPNSKLNHLKSIQIALSCYFLATWTSMAAMELFGWLTLLLTFSYVWRISRVNFNTNSDDSSQASGPIDTIRFANLDKVLPWKSLLILFAVTVLGILINGLPDANKVYVIGSHRWMLLLTSATLALSLWPPTIKGYRIFLTIASVLAVYAIFQSFTGIDLIRPGEHRAVQPLPLFPGAKQLWRSAGTFGSPMGYVYIAGMYSCLPLAVSLLFAKGLGNDSQSILNKYRNLRIISFLVFITIVLSLITTYVRGAWIGMAIAYLVMTGLVNRRFLGIAIGSGATAITTLYFFSLGVRERINSLFNLNYTSNSDRIFLWKINWAIFKDYPILGIGYGQNEARAKEYAELLGNPDAFTGHAHNNYLQMLAGTGVIGFAAYLFIIGFFFYLSLRLWHRLPKNLIWPRALILATIGAQIILHIGGFTECNFKAGATSQNLMIVYGLISSLSLLEAKGWINIGKT